MKNTLHTLLSGIVLLTMALMSISCRDSDYAGEPGTSGESVTFSAAAGKSAPVGTKAPLEGHQALTAGTQVRLQMTGNWYGHTPSTVVRTTTCTAQDDTDGDNINTLSFSDDEKIYWDEFGVADTGNKAGRTGGLTVYAVAVNGATTAPSFSTGWNAVPWTVNIDGTDVSAKDFLYANNLKDGNDGTYKFDERSTSGKNRLNMKHALSQITVNITASDGFPTSGGVGATAHRFESDPVFTLTANGSTGSASEYCATEGTINVVDGSVTPDALTVNKVIAQTVKSDSSTITVIKQALIFPGSFLGRRKDADTVATLVADGNTYLITAAKIRAAMKDYDSSTDYTARQGFNYTFNLTVKRTEVVVSASIEDWSTIGAARDSLKILFNADIVSTGSTSGTAITADGASFSLYKASATSSIATATPSTVTYSSSTSKWSASPVLYWESGSDGSYFRALGVYDNTKTIASGTATSVTQKGTDILWGTTAGHYGYKSDNSSVWYSEGTIINPRTGPVPMSFRHAAARLTVNLETSSEAAKAVELTGAKVKITNLYTAGTLSISDGTFTYSGSRAATAIDNLGSKSHPLESIDTLNNYQVVPQTIADDSKLTVTLADGTTYSLQLNQCTISGESTKISDWASNTHYTYTLHIEKAAVSMSAVIKDWEEKTGEGNADLEWD